MPTCKSNKVNHIPLYFFLRQICTEAERSSEVLPEGLQLYQLLPGSLSFCLVCDLLPLQFAPCLLLQTLCLMSETE